VDSTANVINKIESKTVDTDLTNILLSIIAFIMSAYILYKALLSDDSLFATTKIFLKLMDHIGNVFWINRTPQSIRFCRPLKLDFVKETKEKKN